MDISDKIKIYIIGLIDIAVKEAEHALKMSYLMGEGKSVFEQRMNYHINIQKEMRAKILSGEITIKAEEKP